MKMPRSFHAAALLPAATFLITTMLHAEPLPLIPLPAKVELAEDAGALNARPLVINKLAYIAPADLAPVLERIAREEWRMDNVGRARNEAEANLWLKVDPAMAPGRYVLQAGPQNILLQGRSAAELRTGLQTLRQLAKPAAVAEAMIDGRRVAPGLGTTEFPQCRIEDAPRFAYRGVMLDSARHIQSVAGIKRLLDQMELLKFNVFHWHLTDNNAWRPEVPAFPRLASAGGFLSKTPESERNGYYSTAQMRDIANYARERGIEVIPEIDVPGHSSALAEVHPELLCPTTRRPFPSTWVSNSSPNHVLCVGNEKVYPFLVTVFKQVAAATGAKRVHIGGDEVEEGMWSKCPLCTAVMKKEGFTKEYELERYFLTKLSKLLQAQGLQTINWLERPKSGIPEVNATTVWRGGASGAGHLEAAVEAGVPAINAKGDYAYLDYPQYPGTAKSSWMPVLPLDRVYDFQIEPEAVKKTRPDLLLGGECTLWTEEVIERDIDKQLFPRILAVAEKVWTPAELLNKEDFMQRLALVKPALEHRGVQFGAPVVRDRIIAVPGATVASSLGFKRANYPEYALDGNDVTAYISDKPAKAGDTFTVHFAEPPKFRKVTLITGGFYLWVDPKGRVKSAVLEATTDGTKWTELAPLKDGFATAALPPGVTGLRLRLTGDQDGPLAISEFRLE